MDFQFKSMGRPIPQGHHNEAEGHISLGGGASKHLFQMELPQTSPQLEIRPPKITGVTIEDTEAENCLGKTKFTSAEGCTGTRAQHTPRGRQSVIIFLTQVTLPLDLDWSRSKVHNCLSWLKFYTNLGEGLRYSTWRAIFIGKGT
jgi:hypothetical protein